MMQEREAMKRWTSVAAAAFMGLTAGSAAARADDGGLGGGTSILTGRRVIETTANTFTSNRQQGTSLAVDSKGTVLVAWGSRRQEFGTFGVFAQRFDMLGRAIGTEFHVNEYLPNHQERPCVAIGGDDRAWIAWQSHGQDGSMGSIVARRFGLNEETGTFEALGGEIMVNAATLGDQFHPVVKADASGAAFITWTTPIEDGRTVIVGRMFDRDGVATGDEFRVSDAEAGNESLQAAATLSDGGFVVTWAMTTADGRPDGIRGRVLGADGAPVGAEFAVNENDGRMHIEPAIAGLGDRGFVAAWMRSRDDGAYDVMARRFDRTGEAIDHEAMVTASEADAPGWRSGVAVTAAADGRFAVTYTVVGEKEFVANEDRPEEPSTVWAKAYGADGQAMGGAVQVNQFDEGEQMVEVGQGGDRSAWTAQDELVWVWQGRTSEEEERGVGLTLMAPMGLDAPAPETVERMASVIEEEEFDRQGALIPPIFNPSERALDPDRWVASPGPDFGFQPIADTGWTPPDPELAAGPNHLVFVVNGQIAFYLKDGTRTFVDTINHFWAPVGSNNFVFDPVALWDEYSDRFIVAAAEHDGNADILVIAVSDDADPNGVWHKYRFFVDQFGAFVDFPNLGVGPEAVYIAADYFSGGGNYIHIIPKAALLNGDPTTITGVRTSTSVRSLGSVKSYDAAPPAQYFMTAFSGSSTLLTIEAIRSPLGTPVRNTFNLTVPAFGQPPSANQLGSTSRLDTIDVRTKNGVYRNGHLWVTHTIGESGTARVRWYDIDMRGWPVSGNNPTLVQSGTQNLGSGVHNWFPDLGVTADGDVVMAFSRSSSSEYVSIGRSTRKYYDTLGALRSMVTLQESNSANNEGRWGDYSGIDEDASNPGVFWSHNEYTMGTTSWRTWTGRIDSDRTMILDDPGLMRAGNPVTLRARGAAPIGTVYFVYSLTGPGSTFVGALNVTLDLRNPLLGGSDIADATGLAEFTTTIPPGAPTMDVWLQAAEMNNRTNLVQSGILH